MGRVSKRFLLYYNHGREEEKVRESDFDEVIEKLQFTRYEVMKEIKNFRENLIRYSTGVRSGLSIISDKFFTACQEPEKLSESLKIKRKTFVSTNKLIEQQKRLVFKFNNFTQLLHTDKYEDDEDETTTSGSNNGTSNADETEEKENNKRDEYGEDGAEADY
jgi:hypothetical protein